MGPTISILHLSTLVFVGPPRAGSISRPSFHPISNAPDYRAGSTSCITV
jgi:hypothetical protein